MDIYDFDGVVSAGQYTPKVGDIILTGRCYHECDVVYEYLIDNQISGVAVFFNPMHINHRGNHTLGSRTLSGKHKANVIKQLKLNGCEIGKIFEDDPVQAKIIRISCIDVDIVNVKPTVEF